LIELEKKVCLRSLLSTHPHEISRGTKIFPRIRIRQQGA